MQRTQTGLNPKKVLAGGVSITCFTTSSGDQLKQVFYEDNKAMRSIHLTHYKLFVFNPSQFYRIQVCICDFKHKSPFLGIGGYRGLLCKSNGACSCAGTFDFYPTV